MEDRLIEFAVSVLKIKSKIAKSFESTHLFNQLVRSATASALNYAESKGAESTKDFVHKLSISVKELRESRVNLKIMLRAEISTNSESIELLIRENSELIAILISSIQTTKKRFPALRK